MASGFGDLRWGVPNVVNGFQGLRWVLTCQNTPGAPTKKLLLLLCVGFSVLDASKHPNLCYRNLNLRWGGPNAARDFGDLRWGGPNAVSVFQGLRWVPTCQNTPGAPTKKLLLLLCVGFSALDASKHPNVCCRNLNLRWGTPNAAEYFGDLRWGEPNALGSFGDLRWGRPNAPYSIFLINSTVFTMEFISSAPSDDSLVIIKFTEGIIPLSIYLSSFHNASRL